MAKLMELTTRQDARGSLTVIEDFQLFSIKRVYYIYGAQGERGGHRHCITRQALICVAGSCDVFVDDGNQKTTYRLDRPSKALILEPQDWHTMSGFSFDAVLLVLASENYDIKDYVHEPYQY